MVRLPKPPPFERPAATFENEEDAASQPGWGVDLGEASLPHPEEIRGQVDENQGQSKKKKTGCVLAVVLVLIVAVSLALIFTLGVEIGDGTLTFGGSGKGSGDSASATLDRLVRVTDFVTGRGISTIGAVSNRGSPQYKAALWLAEDDPLKPFIPPTAGGDEDYALSFAQRYILAVLYYSLDGERWEDNLGFMSEKNECDWNAQFRTKSGKTVPLGAGCNNDGEVVKIWTPWENGLVGTLPDEIGGLHSLTSIAMQYGNITGTLPESIGDLSNLIELGFSNNQLTGSVPASLADMKNLQILALDDNSLTGKIFDKLSGLEKLAYVYLEDNMFDGDIGEMDATKLPNLLQLDASTNLLTGTLSPVLFDHPNLEVLDLHLNGLNSGFPSDIPNQSKLKFLTLHMNDLTGDVPSEISNLQGLSYLDLSHNRFDGEIPDSLGTLLNMEYLFIGGNQFSPGPIPGFLRDLNGLKELSLKRSDRTGKIPWWIGELDQMYLLDFDGNSLTGSIPESMGEMTDLFILLLNRNKITGTIPRNFENLKQLEVLLLDDNDLNDDINFLCEGRTNDELIDIIGADCRDSNLDAAPEVSCEDSTCCRICCNDDDPDCNNVQYLINNDPIWEKSYTRFHFQFENYMKKWP